MNRVRGTVTAIALAVAVEALPAAAQDSVGTKETKLALAALYTEGQAARGQEGFAQACGFCHGRRDFSSRTFRRTWTGQTLERFYSFIRTSMPFDNPGRLTDQQYVDIVSYVLQLNEYPTGRKELPPDPKVLSSFQLELENVPAR